MPWLTQIIAHRRVSHHQRLDSNRRYGFADPFLAATNDAFASHLPARWFTAPRYMNSVKRWLYNTITWGRMVDQPANDLVDKCLPGSMLMRSRVLFFVEIICFGSCWITIRHQGLLDSNHEKHAEAWWQSESTFGVPCSLHAGRHPKVPFVAVHAVLESQSQLRLLWYIGKCEYRSLSAFLLCLITTSICKSTPNLSKWSRSCSDYSDSNE